MNGEEVGLLSLKFRINKFSNDHANEMAEAVDRIHSTLGN